MSEASDLVTIALVVALALPALGAVVPAVLLLDPAPARQWSDASIIAATGAWLGVLVAGGHPQAGLIGSSEVVAAAGIGTGLLVLGARAEGALGGVAMTVAMAGLALETGDRPSALGAAVALTGAAALLGIGAPRRGLFVAAAAVANLVAGVAVLQVRDDSWALDGGSGLAPSALIAVGAGLVLVAGALGSAMQSRVPAVPLTAALAVAVQVLGVVPAGQGTNALAVGFGVVGVVASVAAWEGRPGWLPAMPGPSAALGLWSLAAAAGSGPAPALLLATAAVLTAALRHPVALVAAVPGAAAFAAALAAATGVTPAVLGLLFAISAVLVVVAAAPDTEALSGVARGVAGFFAVWLVVAPRTWRWVGDPDLRAYADGLPVAVAAAAGATVAVVAWRARAGRPAPEVAADTG